METFMTILRRWNATKTDREKVQTVQLIVGAVLVLLAGMITFLNVTLGYGMLWVGLVFLGAFFLNAVTWHLMASALLPKLKAKPARKTTR